MKRNYLGDGMLVNYLLLAVRNLKKQRGYAIINTLGLAVGLASALFIFLYVQDELTYDTQHPHAAQTYRLGNRLESPNGESQGLPWFSSRVGQLYNGQLRGSHRNIELQFLRHAHQYSLRCG